MCYVPMVVPHIVHMYMDGVIREMKADAAEAGKKLHAKEGKFFLQKVSDL